MRTSWLTLMACLTAGAANAEVWQLVFDGMATTPQSATVETLRYATKTSTKPLMSELVFTRPASSTTPSMLARLQSQQPFTRATFTLTRSGQALPVQTVTLFEVTVTAVQLAGTGTALTETIFLRFSRLERVTNIFSALTNQLLGSARLDWNLATGVAE